jgi:small-conductance mechanosensitive channel
MSNFLTAWHTIARVFAAPILVLGSTPLSLARLVAALSAFILAAWLARLAERQLRRFSTRRAAHFAEGSAYALARIARYLIVFIGMLIGLSIAGVNFASLAVAGGALGLGIGIGLQPLFVNFVSGIVLMIERSLKVGDVVDLQSGVRGRVVEIAMRYTRVSTNDSVDVLVPNSEFINGRVTNWTYDDTSRRMHIPFGVAYGSDKQLVREAGLAAAARVTGVLLDEPARVPDVWLVAFGDSSLNFELVVWVERSLSSSPTRTQARLLWALEDELSARGLIIPFPQRDLHFPNTLQVQIAAGAAGGQDLPGQAGSTVRGQAGAGGLEVQDPMHPQDGGGRDGS